MQKILIIRTDRMGDLLMSLPAIQAVRLSFRSAEIWLLIQKELQDLLEGYPQVDQILCWDPAERPGWISRIRWGMNLRKHRFTAAVILNPTKLFHAAAFLAGIPKRIGYRRKWGALLTHSIPDTKASRNLHESDYNLELVRLLGIHPITATFSLPQGEQKRREAAQLLSSLGLRSTGKPIAIHPWTSNPVKSWPMPSFQALAGRLARQACSPLIIGEPEVRSEMNLFQRDLPPGAVDAVGQIPLRLLPAVLQQCALLISNDSGPVHVAAAVGTPVFVVAPKEHEPLLNRWRPLGAGHRTFFSASLEEVAKAVEERLLCGF